MAEDGEYHRQFYKRLKAERNSFNRDPPAGVTASPDDETLENWSASIIGPEGTPYEGGVFFLSINYPPSYPRKPPSVKFETKIYHPNISTINGSVFVDILRDQWCPVLSLSPLLVSIQSLLDDPNPVDAIEPEAGDVYISDPEKFDRTAREWTRKYATGEAQL